jgi:hypothetical protein
MSFDSTGYLLTPDDGPQLWFLDTRMNIKAGGAQTGGAFTLIEWSAPAGFGPPLHVHGLPAGSLQRVHDEGAVDSSGEAVWSPHCPAAATTCGRARRMAKYQARPTAVQVRKT